MIMNSESFNYNDLSTFQLGEHADTISSNICRENLANFVSVTCLSVLIKTNLPTTLLEFTKLQVQLLVFSKTTF